MSSEPHFALDLPGARVVFTTRRGGVSSAPYDTLNLGLGTDDDPALVQVNRATLAGELGVELVQPFQVHGTAVMRAPASGGRPQADAVATATPGVGATVLTADCLPIAVAGGGAVAMIHAGWRGLAAGVIAAGVEVVRELGRGGPLAAAIGPAAGPCCYEVGDEVRDRFASYGAQARRGRRLDLWRIARLQLEGAGVASVHELGLCTICSDPKLFFSHRRDGGVTGRQAGVAWLS